MGEAAKSEGMETATPVVISVERVDDVPVLFAHLKRLRVAELLDRHFPPHPLWKGDLSFGEVVCVWLVFLASCGDHRLCNLQPWAQQRTLTLQSCLGKPLRSLDFHDDRLLLSVVVRLLRVVEHQLRQKLAQGGEALTGIYPGQRGRRCERPSAELLLSAFEGMSLSVIEVAGRVTAHATPLTALQQRLLVLWDLPPDLFHRLALHFAEPPPGLSER